MPTPWWIPELASSSPRNSICCNRLPKTWTGKEVLLSIVHFFWCNHFSWCSLWISSNQISPPPHHKLRVTYLFLLLKHSPTKHQLAHYTQQQITSILLPLLLNLLSSRCVCHKYYFSVLGLKLRKAQTFWLNLGKQEI